MSAAARGRVSAIRSGATARSAAAQERQQGERQQGERQQGERQQGERQQGERQQGERQQGERQQGERQQARHRQCQRGQLPGPGWPAPRRSGLCGPRARYLRSWPDRFRSPRSAGAQPGTGPFPRPLTERCPTQAAREQQEAEAALRSGEAVAREPARAPQEAATPTLPARAPAPRLPRPRGPAPGPRPPHLPRWPGSRKARRPPATAPRCPPCRWTPRTAPRRGPRRLPPA